MAVLDDFTVDFVTKRVTHTSGATVYDSVTLYSALQDLFDQPENMDDQVPMSAQTPTEFTMINGWFLDDTSVQFLKGGAIQTVGWVGGIIRQIAYDPDTQEFVAGDITKILLGATTGDRGTILDFDTTRQLVWVRPVTPASDLFDNGGEDYTVESGTGDGAFTATSSTGEAIWGNIFTLGTIESNTDIYVAQEGTTGTDSAVLVKIAAWWTTGQIDVLIKVQQPDPDGGDAFGTLIDEGRLIVFARQYSKLYDNFNLTVTGGRNAVPLATGDDLNNTTGYRRLNWDAGNGSVLVADDVLKVAGTTRAVVGTVSDSGATGNAFYYLIGNPLTDLVNNESVTATGAGESGKTFDVQGAPTAVGPSLDTDITVTFGATGQDINNGNGVQQYSVVIDCNSNTLSTVYERTKFVTRRGETGPLNGQNGEFYLGIGDLKLDYSQDVAFPTLGETVSGATATATGVITAIHDNTGGTLFLILRTVKGTFTDNETITATNGGTGVGLASETITPVKAAPFGTFAGGTFFGARGVFLKNFLEADATNFQLIDSDGVVQVPPNVVVITVAGLAISDVASVFVTSGGDIDKAQHTMATAGGANNTGDSTIIVTSSIGADTPLVSKVRTVDTSTNREQRYRYTTFSGSTFTLAAEVSGVANLGSSDTILIDASATFTTDIEVGDTVRNKTDVLTGFVQSIDSATQLTLSKLEDEAGVIGGSFATGEQYSINTLDRQYTSGDTVYVPIIDSVNNTGTTITNTLTFSTSIAVLARVRQGKVILPFETTGTIGSGGLTVTAIRTTDTIAT